MYGAIDLHSNNNYLVVSDEKDEVVLRRRELNLLDPVLRVLETFGSGLVGVAVESSYNWDWLVDGLMKAGYLETCRRPKNLGFRARTVGKGLDRPISLLYNSGAPVRRRF